MIDKTAMKTAARGHDLGMARGLAATAAGRPDRVTRIVPGLDSPPVIESGIDVTRLSARDRFCALEAAIACYADITPLADPAQFDAAWRLWRLGDLVLSQASFGPLRLERTAQRFSGPDNAFLLLGLYSRGHGRLRIGDVAARNEAGKLHLIDMSRGFSNETSGIATRTLLIPHSLVGYDRTRHPAYLSLCAQDQHGRVLAASLTSLCTAMPDLEPAAAHRLARDLALAVRALMLEPQHRTNGKALRRARRLAIQSHIEARLAQRDLGVADLCATFGLSRASLYRHFPESGGIAGYIRGRRLAAARHALALCEPVRGRVREIAERWGFADPGHFHRLFKESFNLTPGEAASCPPAPVRQAPQLRPGVLLEHWRSEAARHPGRATGRPGLED